MRTATEIGIAISESISDEGLKFIDSYDPDLHYEIMQKRKKSRRKKR